MYAGLKQGLAPMEPSGWCPDGLVRWGSDGAGNIRFQIPVAAKNLSLSVALTVHKNTISRVYTPYVYSRGVTFYAQRSTGYTGWHVIPLWTCE